MMATHPSTPERVSAGGHGSPAVRRARRRLERPGRLSAAIDGLAFGDDPSQGVVRGTTFIHPKLGFAFEAPEGFALENQTSALIGVGEAGGEALRLDSIAIANSTPVATPSPPAGSTASRRLSRADADRWPGGRDGDRAGRPVELSARSGAPRGPALSADLRRALRSLRRRLGFRVSLESFHLINAQDSALAAAQ